MALLAALQLTGFCRVVQMIKVGKGLNFGQKLSGFSLSRRRLSEAGRVFIWKDLGK